MDNNKLFTVNNFINGEFTPSLEYIDSYNPSNGCIWAKIPNSDDSDVIAAVSAAKNAFKEWSKTTRTFRSSIMLKAADLIEKKLNEFAALESRDQGKPVTLAQSVDIPRAIKNMRYFANAVMYSTERSTFNEELGCMNVVKRDPIGVAAQIVPWNLPLYLMTFKIAPAIACGNTVVVKPSEMTSVTAHKFCEVLQEVGLPPGVVNIIYGYGHKVGDALVRHPDIKAISFTGSTVSALKIQEATIHQFKKVSLELGGKNAAIVFNDADMKNCIPGTVRSAFTNQGEVCLCTSRIFVEESCYNDYVKKYVEEVKKLKVGDPSSPDTKIGALISEAHLKKVRSYLKYAQDINATIHCGESVDVLNLPDDIKDGYYFQPTVITGMANDSRLMQEEIFGPIVCIMPFKNIEEAVELANSVQYGLCASIWTEDARKYNKVAQELEVGTVWCNCWLLRDLAMPFGGVKDSGIGREGLKESIEFYTEPKAIVIKT